MKFLKYLIAISVTTTSCALPVVDSPEVGMSFNTKLLSNRTETGDATNNRYNFYLYLGKLNGITYYEVNHTGDVSQSDFYGAVGITNGKIVEIIKPTDVVNLIKRIEKNVQHPERKSTGSYSSDIRNCIDSKLSYPFPVGHNYDITTRVTLTAIGEVLGVQLRRSSGNLSFDRAFEYAVKQCNPFPRPPSGKYPNYIDINYNSRQ